MACLMAAKSVDNLAEKTADLLVETLAEMKAGETVVLLVQMRAVQRAGLWAELSVERLEYR